LFDTHGLERKKNKQNKKIVKGKKKYKKGYLYDRKIGYKPMVVVIKSH
jgi:hypothetical protein